MRIIERTFKTQDYGTPIVSVHVIDGDKERQVTFFRYREKELESIRDPEFKNVKEYYGMEVYSGENYVLPVEIKDARGRSSSRNYKMLKGMPSKYRRVLEYLLEKHAESYKEFTSNIRVPILTSRC